MTLLSLTNKFNCAEIRQPSISVPLWAVLQTFTYRGAEDARLSYFTAVCHMSVTPIKINIFGRGTAKKFFVCGCIYVFLATLFFFSLNVSCYIFVSSHCKYVHTKVS